MKMTLIKSVFSGSLKIVFLSLFVFSGLQEGVAKLLQRRKSTKEQAETVSLFRHNPIVPK